MTITELPVHHAWWTESNVYQIYPASFKDSNGDGVGDIPAGTISELDYIAGLGVDIVWLCPCYKSPQVDMGYDISDYKDIYEKYGTLGDTSLSFVMDLVVNHTSDQHSWFQAAISSKDREYREWYIWKKPNAWEYDASSDEYYLHLFAKEQPDLNWDKDPALPDAPITNPASAYQHGAVHYATGPHLHEYLQGLGKIPKQYDAFSVGEMPMIFQFEIVDLDHGPAGKFTPRTWALTELKAIVDKWQTFMQTNDGWNALYLESHDQARSVSRFASDGPKSGTIFVYQGQELGLANVPKSWGIDKYRDLESLINYEENAVAGASNEILDSILAEMQKKARDNARAPMQWDATDNAGFSTVTPWMDVNEDYKVWNAESQVNDPSSVYAYWQSVFRLRREFKDVLVYGKFALVDALNESVFAYKRVHGSTEALIVTSFKDSEVTWTVPKEYAKPGKILLTNYDRSDIDPEIVLRPFEAFDCWFSRCH
ncbi:glycoside hydrolase superfamily [Lipomyces mesembrius]